LEPLARAHRARDGGDPRPADRGRGDGREHRARQVDDLRRVGDVHRHRRSARRDRDPVRRARLVHDLPVDHPRRRGGCRRACIDLRCDLRSAVHPVRAQPGGPDFEGRTLGDLRHFPDRFHVRDADGGGRVRPDRRGSAARATIALNRPHLSKETQMKLSPARRATLVASAIGLALVMLAAPAAAQKKYGPGASDTEIKLGQTMPYSGPASAYGTIGKLHQAYFKMINDNGGINGRKINLISLDDGYSPPRTVEQVRKLVEQDEVLALFQTLGTPSNSAIHKYVNAKKIPHLLLATGATKWADPKNYPWTLGFNLSYQAEGQIYAKYLLKNKPNAKVAILYQNDDYGKDVLKGVKDGLGAAAAKMIVKEATYEVTDPTIDSQILTLQGSGADTFIDITTPKFGAQAVRKAFDSGWKPLHILNNVSASIGSVLIPAGVEKAVGAMTVSYYKDQNDPQWKDDPAMLEWRAFMGRYYREGDPKDQSNLYGYLAAQIMVQILKQCGNDLTRENVMKQAANLKHFKLPLLLPGMELNTGPNDFFPVQQAHLQKFTGTQWQLFGELMSTDAR